MNISAQSDNAAEVPQEKRNVWPIFISYRRSPATRKVAIELRKELQDSTIEASGEVFRLDVFVDVTAPHQADFQGNLLPHLQHSRALIVLADEGAVTRKSCEPVDYLYEELDWWAEAKERKKTPPIILQLDAKSGSKLVADPKFEHWRKVPFMDCFWEKWAVDAVDGAEERTLLLNRLCESIRYYGQIIQLEEARRLENANFRLQEANVQLVAANKKASRRATVATIFAVSAVIAFCIAAGYWVSASNARDATQKTLATSLTRSIGTTNLEEPTFFEQDAIWDLASASRADALVRTTYLANAWNPSDMETFKRFMSRRWVAYKAAVGTSLSLRSRAQVIAEKSASRLIALMESEQDSYQVRRYAEAFVALAENLSPHVYEPLAQKAVARLSTVLESEKQDIGVTTLSKTLGTLGPLLSSAKTAEAFLKACEIVVRSMETHDYEGGYSDELRDQADAIKALTPGLDINAASELVERLAILIKGEADADNLISLALAYTALALNLNSNKWNESRIGVVDKLVTTLITNPKFNDFGELIRELEPQLPNEVTTKLAAQVVEALKLSEIYDITKQRAIALRSFLNRSPENAVAFAAEELASVLVADSEGAAVKIHGETLAGLAPKLSVTHADELAEHLLEAMQAPTRSYRLGALSVALAGLTGRLDRDAASGIASKAATRLVVAMEKLTDSRSLETISECIPPFCEYLNPRVAEVLANRLIIALEQHSGPWETAKFANPLGALIGKLPAANRDRLAFRACDHLVGQMKLGNEWRGNAVLAAAVSCLPNDPASQALNDKLKQAVTLLVDAMIAERTSYGVSHLAKGLGAVSLRLPSTVRFRKPILKFSLSEAFVSLVNRPSEYPNLAPESTGDLNFVRDAADALEADDLTEILKYPFCVGDVAGIIVDALERKTGRTFGRDVWRFAGEAGALGLEAEGPPIRISRHTAKNIVSARD